MLVLEARKNSRSRGRPDEDCHEAASVMRDAAWLLYFPASIIVALLLSRRWPGPMRRASRCLAAANGLALLCIIATGWMHRAGLVRATHKWVSHGLFILDWSIIPP